jgi:hypothetical protein
MRAIMLQSRAERQALFEPVSEISRRLQPSNLVKASSRFARQKVTKVFGGVSDAVKDNGGAAAAVALGAVAVFVAGRRSAQGQEGADAHMETVASSTRADTASIRYDAPLQSAMTNSTRSKALAMSVGGLLLGHIIGKAFEPTTRERALFGKAGEEIQTAANNFLAKHARGAKIAAAQAFGFARYAAAFLAVLSAASDYFADQDAKDHFSDH